MKKFTVSLIEFFFILAFGFANGAGKFPMLDPYIVLRNTVRGVRNELKQNIAPTNYMPQRSLETVSCTFSYFS